MPYDTPPPHDLPDLARYEDGYGHAHEGGRNLLANFAHAVGLHPPADQGSHALGSRSRTRYGGNPPPPPHGPHRRTPQAPLHTPRRAFAPLVRPDRALFDTLEGQGHRIPLHPGTTVTTRDHRSGAVKDDILRKLHRGLAANRAEQQMLHSKRRELDEDVYALDLNVSDDYLVDIDLALVELRDIERGLVHEIDVILGRAGPPPRTLLPYYSYQADDHFPDDAAEKIYFVAAAYDQRADNLRYNLLQKIQAVAEKGLSVQWAKVMQDIDDIQEQFGRETTVVRDEEERKRQVRLQFERIIEDPNSYYIENPASYYRYGHVRGHSWM